MVCSSNWCCSALHCLRSASNWLTLVRLNLSIATSLAWSALVFTFDRIDWKFSNFWDKDSMLSCMSFKKISHYSLELCSIHIDISRFNVRFGCVTRYMRFTRSTGIQILYWTIRYQSIDRIADYITTDQFLTETWISAEQLHSSEERRFQFLWAQSCVTIRLTARLGAKITWDLHVHV